MLVIGEDDVQTLAQTIGEVGVEVAVSMSPVAIVERVRPAIGGEVLADHRRSHGSWPEVQTIGVSVLSCRWCSPSA